MSPCDWRASKRFRAATRSTHRRGFIWSGWHKATRGHRQFRSTLGHPVGTDGFICASSKQTELASVPRRSVGVAVPRGEVSGGSRVWVSAAAGRHVPTSAGRCRPRFDPQSGWRPCRGAPGFRVPSRTSTLRRQPGGTGDRPSCSGHLHLAGPVAVDHDPDAINERGQTGVVVRADTLSRRRTLLPGITPEDNIGCPDIQQPRALTVAWVRTPSDYCCRGLTARIPGSHSGSP